MKNENEMITLPVLIRRISKVLKRLRSGKPVNEPKADIPRYLMGNIITARGWAVSGGKAEKNPKLAAVVRDCLEYERYIRVFAPHLPFPQNACSFTFTLHGRPEMIIGMPVGLLYHLWEQVPEFTGDCPLKGCGGKVYGYAFGGLLTVGGFPGICTRCDRKMFNFVGSGSRTMTFLRPAIDSSPYQPRSYCFGTPPGISGEPLIDFIKMMKKGGTGRLVLMWDENEESE